MVNNNIIIFAPWSQDSGSVFQAKKPGCPPRVWPVHRRTGFPAKSEEGSCWCTEGGSSSGGRSARPWGNQERHRWGIFCSLFPLFSLKPGDEEWFLISIQMRSQQLLLQGTVCSQRDLSWRGQQPGWMSKVSISTCLSNESFEGTSNQWVWSVFLKNPSWSAQIFQYTPQGCPATCIIYNSWSNVALSLSTCFILLVSGCCFCMSVIFWHGCTLIPLSHLCFLPFFCVEQVPIVAVTTAGCGIRALTAMYGSILGLQKLRVLDCVSYISGSSGTTWWGVILILFFGSCCVKQNPCFV